MVMRERIAEKKLRQEDALLLLSPRTITRQLGTVLGIHEFTN